MCNSDLSKYLWASYGTRSTLAKLGGVLMLALGFAYGNRGLLFTEIYEIGDLAANSLLIQHAKHFELLTGHYSRVGFYHPGPVILYVLACGEWLFYDCTGLVKSPLAGQLLAAGIYNAAWIVALSRLLFRMFRSVGASAAALFTLLAATYYLDRNTLSGLFELWFPYLFYLPFATFILALATLSAGRGETLVTAIISCGFLVHGHVSFLAICGFMVAGALLINHFQAARGAAPRVLSRGFVKINAGPIWLSAIIAIIFLSPLIVESMCHPPGPIWQYVTFGRGHRHNTLLESLQFLAQYWRNGITPLLATIFVLSMVIKPNSATSAARAAGNYVLWGLLLASAATLFYTVFGIDDLQQKYLGLFYYAVPALTIAILIGQLVARFSRISQTVSATSLAIATFAMVGNQTSQPADYLSFCNSEEIPRYFAELTALQNNPVVLDLDNSQDWGNIWSKVLGIEIYAVRHGAPQLFCINKNWHLSFGAEARCSAQQIEHGTRYLVSAAPQPFDNLQSSNVEFGTAKVYKIQLARLAVNQMFDVAGHRNLYMTSLLVTGWTTPDTDFVWTEGQTSQLAFNVDHDLPPQQIEFDLAAYLPRADSQQRLDIAINSIPAGTIYFDSHRNRDRHVLRLTPAMIPVDGTITVRFSVAKPTSPQSVGQSSDPRLLGVGLYGIALKN